MKIPFDWKPNVNEFQKVWDDLNKEPLHSGKLNFWRRVRLVCVYLQTLIKRMILNEQVNFSNEDSTVNNTLDFIGDVLDDHDARIKTNAHDIDVLEGRMDTAEEEIRQLHATDENFDDRITTWEQQVQTNTANIGILSTRVDANTTELNEQNKRIAQQETELNDLQGDLEKTVIPDLQEAQSGIAELENEVQGIQDTIVPKVTELDNSIKKLNESNVFVNFDVTDKASPTCDTILATAITNLNQGGKVAVKNGTTNIINAEVNRIGESDIVVQLNSLEKTGDQWNITYNSDGVKLEESKTNAATNSEDIETAVNMINDLQRFVNFTVDFTEGTTDCDVDFAEAKALIDKGTGVKVNDRIQLDCVVNDSVIRVYVRDVNPGEVWRVNYQPDNSITISQESITPKKNADEIERLKNTTSGETININMNFITDYATCDVPLSEAKEKLNSGAKITVNNLYNGFNVTIKDDIVFYISNVAFTNDVWKVTYNESGIAFEIEKGKPHHVYEISEKDFKEFLSKIEISPAPAITNESYEFSTLKEANDYLNNFLNQFKYLQDGDYINVNMNTSSFVDTDLSEPDYMLLFKSYSAVKYPESSSYTTGSLINPPYSFELKDGLGILFSLQFVRSTKDFISYHPTATNNLFDIFYCLDELYFYVSKNTLNKYEIHAVCSDIVKMSTLTDITNKIATSLKSKSDTYHLDANPTWSIYSQDTKGYQKFSDFGFVDYFYSMEPMSGTDHYFTLFDSTKYIKKAQFIRIFCVDMFTTKSGSNIVKEGDDYFYTLPNSVTMTKTLSNGYFVIIDISGSVTFSPSEIVDLNANGLVKKYKAISAIGGLSGDTIEFSGKHICLYYIPTIALSAFPVRQ